MTYALINSKGRILKTSEEELKSSAEGRKVIELTEDQAVKVGASSEILFLVGEKLLTYKAKLWLEQPEILKSLLRPERDRLLTASDWTQLNDTSLPEETVSAWAAYRQDLRDLTDEIDENGEVDFPEKP